MAVYTRNKRDGRCEASMLDLPSCKNWVGVGKGWRYWKGGEGQGRTGGRYILLCPSCREGHNGGKTEVEIKPEVEAVVVEDLAPPKDKKATVAEALAELLGGVDEGAVRAIAKTVVDEALRELKAVTLEVNLADRGITTKVEGGHSALDETLRTLQAGPVLLVGPAGAGKTTLAEHVAQALALPFYFNGAIASEYKLTGFVDAGGTYHVTSFRQAFEHGGVYLFDELDASAPQALLAFNAGLANGHMDFPDSATPIVRHKDFVPLASANTWGTGADRQYVGRNQLDAATLDRFLPVEVGYDKHLEQALAGEHQDWLHIVWGVRAKVEEHRLRHVVSTRAVVRGRILLEAGAPQVEVENKLLRRNLSKDDWKRVRL